MGPNPRAPLAPTAPALLLLGLWSLVTVCPGEDPLGPGVPPSPVLDDLSPAAAVQGAAVDVTLTGANFAPGATVAVSGSGVAVSDVTVVDAGEITTTFAVAEDASPGARQVTVATEGGTSGPRTFTVEAASPTLTGVDPAGGAQGAAVDVTLTGSNFASGATVAVSGSGVAVSDVTVVDAGQITATFAVAEDASPGARQVTVATEGGTSGPRTFTVETASPTLTGLDPAGGVQGTVVDVVLTGTGFEPGAEVAVSSGGVAVSDVTMVGPGEITATFTIGEAAPGGGRQVTVTTEAGTSGPLTFTVDEPAPVLTSVDPSSGLRGTSVGVTLTGADFMAGASVAVSGSGVAVSGVTVVDPTEITATFTVDAAAAPGDRDVTVTTGAGTSGSQTFTVVANDAPTAGDDAFATDEDATLNVSAPGVLADDSDPDGDPLTAVLEAGPSNGSVTLNADGSFTYVPDPDFFGGDSFTYRADDGIDASAPATVSLTVAGVNDAPTFTKGPDQTVQEDAAAQTVTGWATDLSTGPANESGQALTGFTVTANTNPGLFAAGPSVDASTGDLTYEPAADASGTADVTIELGDDGGTANGGTDTSAGQTFTITVTAAPPTLTGVSPASGAQGAAVGVTLTGADFMAGASVAVSGSGVAVSGVTVVDPTEITATFTVDAAAAPGDRDVTVTTGAGTSGSRTFTVTANDAPTAGDDAFATDEDATLNVSAPGVLADDSDPDGDPLTAVLEAGPSNGSVTLNADGSFTYVPDADFFGGDSFTYRADDGIDASAPATVSLTVAGVNDAPTFTKGPDQTVQEDAAAQTVTGWATDLSPGPANESGQALTGFTVTANTNPGLFAAGPSVDASTGDLTYEPAADANGTADVTIELGDDGGTANGGTDTSAGQTFTITVTAAPPTLTGVSPASGAQGAAVGVTLTGADFMAGASVAVSGSGVAVSGVTVVDPTEINATFTVDAAAAPGDRDVTVTTGAGTSGPRTFTVTANDAPTAGDDAFATDEDATLNVSAPGVLADDSDPEGDPLTAVLEAGPSNGSVTLNADGSFTYVPDPDFFGGDSFTYRADDGIDASAPATVSLTVAGVNDAPTFTKGPDQTVQEDAAAQTVTGWATDLSPGPANESGQALTGFTVTANTNPGLFAAGPSVDASTGDLTYEPAADANGTADVTIELGDDGGTANGGTDTSAGQTFTITVEAVNDAPEVVASPTEDFRTAGNTALQVASTRTESPAVFVGGDLVSNFTDPDGDALTLVRVENVSAGAVVNPSADGSFVYVPAPGATASDAFDYVVSDGTAEVTRTVTVGIDGMVWYVDGSAAAGGTGTSAAPFQTLAGAEGASAAGEDVFLHEGDSGTTPYDGVTLQANQRLVGEPAGLTVTVGGSPVTAAAPAGARPRIAGGAGTAVTLASGSAVEAVDAVSGATGVRAGPGVSGSALTDVAVEGVTDGVVLDGATGTFTFTRLDLDGTTGTGFLVDGGDPTATVEVAASGTSVGSGDAVAVRNTTGGSVTFTGGDVAASGAGGIVVSSAAAPVSFQNAVTVDATSADAVSMTSSSGDLTFSDLTASATGHAALVASGGTGTLTVDAGSVSATDGLALDVSGNPATLALGSVTADNSAGGGVLLSNTAGTKSLGAVTLTTTDGPGLRASSAGTVNVSDAASSVSTTNRAALDLDNTGGMLTFGTVSSSGSTTSGILLAGATATVSISGGTISGASGPAVDVASGSAALTYGGDITNSAGRSVEVTGTSGGGSVTLNGDVTDTGDGIFLDSNVGATAAFTGALDLTTGTSPAFTATGGGTVTATGSGSDLAATSGAGVNITNTTIGASGVTFRSVSSDGGSTPGITLMDTGASGGLTVTGDGGTTSNGSGGTIRNKTGASVVLTDTRNVSLSQMDVLDGGTNGIEGTRVTGFVLEHSTVRNHGTGTSTAPVRFTNLWGTDASTPVRISGSVVDQGDEDNIQVENDSGTLDRLRVTDSTIGSATTGEFNANDGIRFEGLSGGNAVMNLTVSGSTFLGNGGDHVNPLHNGSTGSMDVVITGNGMSGTQSNPDGVGGGITVASANGNTVTYEIANNDITDVVLVAIDTNLGTSSFSTEMSGTIDGNVVGTAGVAGSGSSTGVGIRAVSNDAGTHTVAITGNTIRNWENGGGITVQWRDGTGVLNATVTGNVESEPGSFANGLNVTSGAASGDTGGVCAEVGGSGGLSNTFETAGGFNGADIVITQRSNGSAFLRLPGYSGAATGVQAETDMQTYFSARNSIGSHPTRGVSAGQGSQDSFLGEIGDGITGGSSCPTP